MEPQVRLRQCQLRHALATTTIVADTSAQPLAESTGGCAFRYWLRSCGSCASVNGAD